ncbi:glucose dehydrogenase [bacterium]|nr:glucose dehydrogenase [bacterium]
MLKRALLVTSLSVIIMLAACSSPSTPTLGSTQTSAPSPLPSETSLPTQSPTNTQVVNTPAEPASSVASFPDPANFQWAQVANGLAFPVALSNAGDGSGRIFILEKKGLVRVLSNGQLLATAFLDIRDRAGSKGSEQGLLGIAFHPNFKQNGFFYVDYTNTNGDTTISRFYADPSTTAADQVADPASEKILLTVKQPFANHNGGHILFGPDGMLYIGMGDGGSGGDPNGNGQSLQTLLGKILRIDVNTGDPYAIPPNNPFAAGGGLPEIWAYGLRNPWSFSFDAQTGDLFIADVGQDKWEEIDYLPAEFTAVPANFGWNIKEGTHPYKEVASPPANLIDPVYEYSHDLGCSITGGGVYRGKSLTAFNGIYLYADYCAGTIWGLIHQADGSWQNKDLFETGLKITGFGTDENGELYFVTQEGGVFELAAK